MKAITQQCELLLSYPIGKLFTKDSPSPKEKKLEARCSKIVDSYYKIDNPVHMHLRGFLHELQSSFNLGFNEVYLQQLFYTCGSLQALYESYRKDILSKVKQEPILKEYYSDLQKADWFGMMVNIVKGIADKYNFEVDVKLCKEYFVKGLKFEKGE